MSNPLVNGGPYNEIEKPKDGIVGAVHKFPMEGVELWKNPKNRFLIFQLHYTANPLKRDPNWKSKVRSGLSRSKFMQEYEIAWDAYLGKPVYSDFAKKIHGSQTRLSPERGLPLLRGWDFGLTPACIIGQMQGRQLVILKEFVAVNMGIKRFASEVVLPGCRLMYPEWNDQSTDFLDFIDPAGLQRAQTDETTCAQHMFEAGIRRIFPGALTFEARRKAVEDYLLRFFKRGQEVIPGFRIDLAACPTLVEGFEGGYQYPKKTLEVEPEKIRPLKNKFSHPHDGLQYLASMVGLLARPGFAGTAIPVPSYSLGRS